MTLKALNNILQLTEARKAKDAEGRQKKAKPGAEDNARFPPEKKAVTKKATSDDDQDGQDTDGEVVKTSQNAPPAKPKEKESAVAIDKKEMQKDVSLTSADKKDIQQIPAGGKTITGEIANKIDTDPIIEAVQHSVVFSFGRMNPPTIGHQKLVDAVERLAKEQNAVPMIFLSKTSDGKSNPLPYKKKLAYAKQAFGSVIKDSKGAPTLFSIASDLSKQGFVNATMVVGSDRVAELKKKFAKYIGTPDFKFAKFTIISAGERDPDSDEVAGASASKLRAAAKTGDMKAFVTGLPSKLRVCAHRLFKDVRLEEGITPDEITVLNESTINNVVKLFESRREEPYELSEKEIKSLQSKSDNSSVPLTILEQVFRRGVYCWLQESTNLTHQQFAFNRVNSFLAGGAACKLDEDLVDQHIDSMIVEDEEDLSVLSGKKKDVNGVAISPKPSKKNDGKAKLVDPSKAKPDKPMSTQTLMRLVYEGTQLMEHWDRNDPSSSGYHHGYYSKHMSHDDLAAKFPKEEHQNQWHAANKKGVADRAQGKKSQDL